MSLVASREIKVGAHTFKTPRLVPSFSSKVLVNLDAAIETMSEFITDTTLISAYDIHHSKLKGPITFPDLLIIDSGGYESLKDAMLEDLEYTGVEPKVWSVDLYEKVLDEWKYDVPTAIVSYDHPSIRQSIEKQIAAATELFNKKPLCAKVFLIKPENEKDVYLNVNSIVKNIRKLGDFDIIGLTEKELGENLIEKMLAIAKIRQALTKIDLKTPIHIFGSLDTVTTPLYFLSGADIFDGLTWLRFAFYQGFLIYQTSYGPLKFDLKLKDYLLQPRCWSENINELKRFENVLEHYISERKFECFRYHSEFIKSTYEVMLGKLKEV